MTNVSLNSLIPYTPGTLTLIYNEYEQAFHIYRNGKKLMTLSHGDMIPLRTFREMLETLIRMEELH